ncbi:hypothetical protein H9P43_001901 [Blastocladiella emersonii ATCC 22665]|nr:hypothetical protein H9P43_001901 [Blastocladiella emersonii ATCC 22665]
MDRLTSLGLNDVNPGSPPPLRASALFAGGGGSPQRRKSISISPTRPLALDVGGPPPPMIISPAAAAAPPPRGLTARRATVTASVLTADIQTALSLSAPNASLGSPRTIRRGSFAGSTGGSGFLKLPLAVAPPTGSASSVASSAKVEEEEVDTSTVPVAELPSVAIHSPADGSSTNSLNASSHGRTTPVRPAGGWTGSGRLKPGVSWTAASASSSLSSMSSLTPDPVPLGRSTSNASSTGSSASCLVVPVLALRAGPLANPNTNTPGQSERAQRNLVRWRKCVRLLGIVFRVFALYERADATTVVGPTTAAAGAGPVVVMRDLDGTHRDMHYHHHGPTTGRKGHAPFATPAKGQAAGSGGGSGFGASLSLVLSDFAASRAMFALSPAVRRALRAVPRTDADVHLIATYLRHYVGLKRFSRRVVRDIAGAVDLGTVHARRVVLREGHRAVSIYLIVSGTCEAYKTETLDDGRVLRRVLRPLAAGDMFGDLAVFHDTPRTASVVTTSQCELLRIDKPEIDRILAADRTAEAALHLAFLAPTTPVGRAMTDAERAALAGVGIVRELNRDDVVVHQGQSLRAVYFVRRGTVRVVRWVEFWRQRIDTIPATTPLDGVYAAPDSEVADHRHRDAVATPRFMVWHRIPANAAAYDERRGDRVDGRFLVVGVLKAGDFFEEQSIHITPNTTASPRSTATTATTGDASRHVVDAYAVFAAQATYIADEADTEVVEFPNAAFLKAASDATLAAMQTVANMRPRTDALVRGYLRARAYGKVKSKIVEEVVARKKRADGDRKFFGM